LLANILHPERRCGDFWRLPLQRNARVEAPKSTARQAHVASVSAVTSEAIRMSEEKEARADGMTSVMERNIRTLLERRMREEQHEPRQVRVADAITRFTGSMAFVYIHAVLFGGWIAINLPWVPWPKFDPTFVILAMFASVEAIFLSTFVLISQNRMQQRADKRADLDLQINLLGEHEITRLVSLVKSIAEKLDVEASRDASLRELEQDVAPERVLDALERTEAQVKPR
jgi:uncharacterized membrane protein